MLQELLTHGLTSAVLRWLRGARVADAALGPEASVELCFSPAYRVTVVILGAVATALLAGTVVIFHDDPQALVMTVAIFGALWLATFAAVYDAFGVRLTAAPRGVTTRSWFGGERFLPWERLSAVTYNSNMNWYRFRSDQGWSVRVSIFRSGLGTFAQLVRANIQRSPARSVPARFFADMA